MNESTPVTVTLPVLYDYAYLVATGRRRSYFSSVFFTLDIFTVTAAVVWDWLTFGAYTFRVRRRRPGDLPLATAPVVAFACRLVRAKIPPTAVRVYGFDGRVPVPRPCRYCCGKLRYRLQLAAALTLIVHALPFPIADASSRAGVLQVAFQRENNTCH